MELVIVQQNVCGREMYNGNWGRQDYEKLIKALKRENPDIIFLTEFYYQQMYDITQKIFEEYEFIKPISLSEDDENKEGLYAACALAVKQSKVIKDKQFELENMIDFRYICVDLNIGNGQVIKTLLMYVPQTYNSTRYRVEQKRKMIHSANIYVKNNCNTLLFVGGDMNSDIDGKTTTCINDFEEIYNRMIDTDCKKEATWNGKRLDYALVSGITKNSVNTIPIDTNSDHRGLRTVFRIENPNL